MSNWVSCKSKILLNTPHFSWLPATSQTVKFVHGNRTGFKQYGDPDNAHKSDSTNHRKPLISLPSTIARNRQYPARLIRSGRSREAMLQTLFSRNLVESTSKNFEDLLVPVKVDPIQMEEDVKIEKKQSKSAVANKRKDMKLLRPTNSTPLALPLANTIATEAVGKNKPPKIHPVLGRDMIKPMRLIFGERKKKREAEGRRRETKRQGFSEKRDLDELFAPLDVHPRLLNKEIDVEFEGVEDVDPKLMAEVLENFRNKEIIRELAKEHDITERLFGNIFRSFRDYCLKSKPLDPDLKVIFSDIVKYGHSVDQLFVFFLTHARKMYPHLECMKELKSISDLTQPHNWYPLARTIQRKVIFHAGPTNSGKTHEALQAFKNAKSGAFCGPLRLLAAEVFRRMNAEGCPCDLVTGDDRQYAIDNMNPVSHIACTVEMLSSEMHVDLIVIDEIQMLRDTQRGSSWTRALLGAAADEIHLCGEKAAVPIVKKILDPIGEHVEVKEYERKSKLVVSTHGLRALTNIQPGDCIVTFNKKTIFDTVRKLEKSGVKCAVIYGDLPAATKRLQAESFNDPNDPTKVLVSTDAIGMGLNLNIKRIIFERLTKPPFGDLIAATHVKQIAGRAGRFASQYTEGEVMTLNEDDMCILRGKMEEPIEDIAQVGIMPGFEQVELFSHHLPKATFVNILEIFQSIATISGDFFLSEAFQNMLKISKVLHNYDLPLKTRYTFCLVPYNIGKSNSKENLLVSVIERYIGGQPITANFIATLFRWPLKLGKNLDQLTKLEDAYEFFDVYLWLSYRFPDMFTEPEKIRDMQIELNKIILETIRVIIFQDEPKCDDELLNNLLHEEIPETEENITDEIALEEDFRVEFEAGGVKETTDVEVEAREEKESQETNTIQNEEKKLI